MPNPIQIAELTTDAALAAAFPLMSVLRPHLAADTFVAQVRAQQRDGYRLVGGSVDGQLVALAGYRRTATLFRGPHLFVDDLVTAPDHQGKGHATALLRHLAAVARAEGVEKIWLDSRITARTYYEKVGFTMITSIPCWIEASALQPRSGDEK